MNELFLPISSLKGVGKARKDAYKKLNVFTPYDLLYYIPRTYLDFSQFVPISETIFNEMNVVRAKIFRKTAPTRIRDGLVIYKAFATDGESDISIVIYNNNYAFNALQEGETYYMYGKITGNYLFREISSPQFIQANGNVLIQPIYRLTAGITVNMIRINMKQSVELLKKNPIETLPDYIINEYGLCDLMYALENIHFPESDEAHKKARKRLAFDEILRLQLGMALMKSKNKKHTANIMNPEISVDEFYNHLPFEMTEAQINSIQDIIDDLCSDVPMNRLLQGDVGSGKTAVAAAACYFAVKNGFQTALMAPTEILATQHYHTLCGFLEPLGIRVCLLTGSLTAKKKNDIKLSIMLGCFDVIVGTHAIIQQDTVFKSLALVITDEQHRFGVSQRLKLAEKGDFPHKLVMSATPIPRTLALIIYGDLDVSVIDQLPKGRKPISTYAVTGKLRERGFGFVRKSLETGRQAYVVCPMIEESESDLIAVNTYSKQLSETFLKGYSLGVLHGKMNAIEKESIMASFKKGDIQVLICTTVVEVGVDVPNASIIVIENADRFGLSQLHQLRGRVGRGEFESSCILITDNTSEECRERMKIMCKTSNGFEISEKDLELRGPGDFFGSKQHGLPQLKIADLACDMDMVADCQKLVQDILKRDSKLELPEHKYLKSDVIKLFDKELIG